MLTWFKLFSLPVHGSAFRYIQYLFAFYCQTSFFFLYFLCFVRPSPVTEKLWVAIFFMVWYLYSCSLLHRSPIKTSPESFLICACENYSRVLFPLFQYLSWLFEKKHLKIKFRRNLIRNDLMLNLHDWLLDDPSIVSSPVRVTRSFLPFFFPWDCSSAGCRNDVWSAHPPSPAVLKWKAMSGVYYIQWLEPATSISGHAAEIKWLWSQYTDHEETLSRLFSLFLLFPGRNIWLCSC